MKLKVKDVFVAGVISTVLFPVVLISVLLYTGAIHFDVGVDETDDQRRKIYNYLSELEVVCQYHEDGIMTTTQVYELLGSGIIDVMRIDPIVDLIEEDRKKPHQADLYDNLQKTFGIMIDHQNKKFKKNTPENIREFVNKKLQ